MKVKTLEELVNEGALEGKRVFIRADMNVPRDAEGNVTDDHRLKESMPAVKMALKGGAGVMVCSHLGRPKEGELTEQDSLAKVAETFGKMLGMPIRFEKDWLNGVDVKPGEVVILENCRGNVGEKKNDPELVKKMAKLCDVYVNDAFGTAHRAQATTDGLAREAEVACAGPLLAKEIKALTKAVAEAKRPLVAIVGGSKVSTKLTILKHLAPLVDTLIVGGGIANTFLLAEGHHIGTSLAEPALVGECKEVMKIMKEKGGHLPLPVDVVVAHHIGYDAGFRICDLDDIEADEMILDIGPKTSKMLAEYLKDAKTIIGTVRSAFSKWTTSKKVPATSQKKLPKLLLTVLSRLSAAAIRLLRRKPLRWQIKFLISLQAAVPSLNSLKARHCLLSQPFRKELSNSLF